MLMASVHLGTKNTDHQMRRYIFKRRADTSVNIIDLHKTWEKMLLAARVLVAIENPKVSTHSPSESFTPTAPPHANRAAAIMSRLSELLCSALLCRTSAPSLVGLLACALC